MKVIVVGANSNIARNFIFANKNRAEFLLYDYQEKHADGYENYLQLDLSDKEKIAQIDCDADIIYYFVGLTGSLTDLTKITDSITVNQIYLVNFLNRLTEVGFKGKFVFPSTRLVYKGTEMLLTEVSSKEMKTAYGVSKFACEKLIEIYHLLSDLQYAIVRICVPYGTLIPTAKSYGTMEFFLSKALKGEDITIYGDGRQRRTFTHMKDLVEILFLCGINEDVKNDVYNVGGQDYSLYDAAKIVAKISNVNVTNIEWPEYNLKIETGSTVFDSSKLDKKIMYKYNQNIEEWANGEQNV